MYERLSPRWRIRLDSLGFWLLVAWAMIGVIIILMFYVVLGLAENRADQRASDQARAARVAAEAKATFERCRESIPALRRVSRHVRGVNAALRTILENARRAYEATPPGDPQRQVRYMNWQRLRAAVRDATNIGGLPVPTLTECAGRRRAILAAG